MGEGCEGVWCGGRRREAVGGSLARRRLCGGSSSPVHVAQNDPCACERAKGGKVKGRAAAKAAPVATRAAASVPPLGRRSTRR